ncbi:MAG: cation:dicarboxylate symporter family transporter, partial [Candidatus Kapaibacterium sp.]
MKKLSSIPLHLQILFALAAGAVFGAFFNVDQDKLIISHTHEGERVKTTIDNWRSAIIAVPEEDIMINFDDEGQIQLIKSFRRINRQFPGKPHLTIINAEGEQLLLTNIISIRKEKTAATVIRPVGELFIRLLSFLAIPLVIASLIIGAASLDDVKKLGRIGGKTFLIYITTTLIAITIGLTCANLIQPGKQVTESSKNRLM